MVFKTKQILELKNIIDNINNAKNDKDRNKFVNEHIDDVELFLNVLKEIDGTKLNLIKIETRTRAGKTYNYKRDEVLDIFSENSIEDIVRKYTSKELIGMYFVIFDSNPISSFNKTRIAQTIYNYVYAMDRASTLLSGI